MAQLRIDDTTLRDGEQTAGVVFANAEKLRIAKMLSDIGVHQIEAGIPTMGGDEHESIKAIVKMDLPTSILAWNRADVGDVKASLECGVNAVAISISASDIHIQTKLQRDRNWVLEAVKRAVDFAKQHNLYVSVNAEDASRADPEFLAEFARTAKNHGADRLRYCDTVGALEPFDTYRRIRALLDAVDIEIEMHMHNDFGMATANSIAGILAGATWVNVTVNGLGERAGNASLEEVVMALKHIEGTEVGIDVGRFRALSQYVAQASGRTIPPFKPVVGTDLFVYESASRGHGALSDPPTYELFHPEEVGLTRRFVIGKYSGSREVKSKLAQYALSISDDVSHRLAHDARSLSMKLKRSLMDQELIELYQHDAALAVTR